MRKELDSFSFIELLGLLLMHGVKELVLVAIGITEIELKSGRESMNLGD